MTRLLLLYSITLFFSECAFSQGYSPVGARSSSMSNSSVCLSDVWAFHHNPGAIAKLTTFSAGAYYESRFLTKELQTQGIVAAIPLKKGVISAGGQFTGYEQYRSTRAGLGYSLGLGEKLSTGVQINMQQLRLGGNYGSSTTATFEAGLLADITEKWKIGASVLNVGRQRIQADLSDRYTSVLRIGAFYQPSKKVIATAEIAKDVINTVSFRGGIEYLPAEYFVIRAGAQTGPASFAFGVGYRKKGFYIDAGTNYHQILGWTPHFGLTYQLAKDAQK